MEPRKSIGHIAFTSDAEDKSTALGRDLPVP